MSSSIKAPFLGYTLFARAFESSTDAVELNDMAGAKLYVNDAYWKLFQRGTQVAKEADGDAIDLGEATKAELKRTWDECLSKDTSKGMLRLGRAGTAVSYVRNLHKTSDEMPSGVVTIYREIEANHYEGEASQSIHLASVLRNLLTTISENLVLIENKGVDDQVMLESLHRIAEAVERGVETVNRV